MPAAFARLTEAANLCVGRASAAKCINPMKTGAQARPSPTWATMAVAPLGANANSADDTTPTASSQRVGAPTP
ncbi:hypothetical protein D3C86_2019750 [compost metagenome]